MTRSWLWLPPLALFLCAFSVVDGTVPQPFKGAGERAAQAGLPQAKTPLWSQLGKCHVTLDSKTQLYGINVLPEVKALNGQTVRMDGFVLPMDGSDKTKYFLLAKRTPV